ncbi:MAG: phenylalanine--tRNA ligase subunit beta [Limisphaerales bacterium]
MKITFNWLKRYVEFDWTPDQLSERLTMLGLEVEGVVRLGGAFSGIVVAEVLTRDRHPNADKLSVCRVHDGQGERQIVCGAQNFKPGDKVPLILPGSTLPARPGEEGKAPFVIKVGKLRGVESHGMMCSADELGLDPAALGLSPEEGLLILKPESRVGQALDEYLGRGGDDVVYDLEVTPNRPDLNSVIGIAREIAAITGNPVRWPELVAADAGEGESADSLVDVRIDAPDLGPRYTARIVRGVKIGPSPDWLRTTLEKVGLRSINNVVDVTNFVMLETGQPLHAFDYHLLARGAEGRPTVIVRRGADAEKFVTLDGKEHLLGPENLLIADPEKAIALAGVMGGRNTEINERTVDVLLESAYFSPTGIRRTSKSLGIRTDSSYRFERGADEGITDWASRRAAHLILETAGGKLARGAVDAHPAPPAPRQITLRHAKVGELLGVALRPEEIEAHLGALGLRVVNRRPRSLDETAPPDPVVFSIPSHRVDLKREVDLIEEVARLHGVDRIPSTPPRHAKGAHPFDAQYDELMLVRRWLTGLGLSEAQGQTLISKRDIRGLNPSEIVELANPLSADMDALRPSLLPGLLDVLRHNLRHRNGDAALFEIGRVFRRENGGGLLETRSLGLAMTGARQPAFWQGTERDARLDLSDLKGVIEEFFEHAGLRGISYTRRTEPSELFVEAATVALGGKRAIGQLGWVSPALAKAYDLRDAVLLAEFDLDILLARRQAGRSFKTLPAFPSVRRDVAMVVPEEATHEAVLQAVRQAKAGDLEGVELFDVFRGGSVPEGRKSVAYAFTYRGADRTLTDAEVTASHAKVLEQLKVQLGATLRE